MGGVLLGPGKRVSGGVLALAAGAQPQTTATPSHTRKPVGGLEKMPRTRAWVSAKLPDQDPADSRAPRLGPEPGTNIPGEQEAGR